MKVGDFLTCGPEETSRGGVLEVDLEAGVRCSGCAAVPVVDIQEDLASAVFCPALSHGASLRHMRACHTARLGLDSGSSSFAFLLLEKTGSVMYGAVADAIK